jgi:hypothetical protein
VEMHVVDSHIPRNRHLRCVTLDTFLKYREDLYKEDKPVLQTEFVDTTFVSGVLST